MTQTFNVAVLVGSLRQDSVNRKFAKALIEVAPPSLALSIVEIGDLPFYNPDDDTATPPPRWTTFRETIKRADAVLFVTPEYNRSIPAALKNAIDIASRPYGKGAWTGKPGAVVSVSPGAAGGFGAAQHLRQMLVCVNVPVLTQPEASIGNAENLLAPDGTVNNDATRKFLQHIMAEFANWITMHANRAAA